MYMLKRFGKKIFAASLKVVLNSIYFHLSLTEIKRAFDSRWRQKMYDHFNFQNLDPPPPSRAPILTYEISVIM